MGSKAKDLVDTHSKPVSLFTGDGTNGTRKYIARESDNVTAVNLTGMTLTLRLITALQTTPVELFSVTGANIVITDAVNGKFTADLSAVNIATENPNSVLVLYNTVATKKEVIAQAEVNVIFSGTN